MDAKTALKIIKMSPAIMGGNSIISADIKNEAVKALERQIPIKIKEEKWIATKCKCGHIFSKHYGDGYHDIPFENKTKYCPDCGQKLDWENIFF